MRVFLVIFFCFVASANFCQNSSHQFISEKEAVKTAKRHGLYPLIKLKNRLGWIEINWMDWGGAIARLDTVNKTWEIRAEKLSYRDWGKTTRLSKKDPCQRCRFINGCHVLRSRKVWIEAVSGKFVRKEKKKKISGNYE